MSPPLAMLSLFIQKCRRQVYFGWVYSLALVLAAAAGLQEMHGRASEGRKGNQLPTITARVIKSRAGLCVVLGRYLLCAAEVGGFLPIQATRVIAQSAFKWHSVGPAS